jgi:DNA-binding transcriptional LysR family regulator
MSVAEGDHQELIAGLRNGELAAAITHNIEVSEEIASVELADLVPYILLPAAHLLAMQPAVRLADLAKEPMVLLDLPPTSNWLLGYFQAAGLEPRVAYRTRSFEMVRSLVGNGHGFAILLMKPTNAMSYDGKALISRPLVDPVTPIKFVIARLRGKTADDVECFICLCKEFFQHGVTHEPWIDTKDNPVLSHAGP